MKSTRVGLCVIFAIAASLLPPNSAALGGPGENKPTVKAVLEATSDTPNLTGLRHRKVDFALTFSEADENGLAVAFHDFTFIDAAGFKLLRITMTDLAVLGWLFEGWLETGHDEVVGEYQWGGAETGTARIRLPVPNGSEGVLIRMKSAPQQVWTTIQVGDDEPVSLRVNRVWQSGYVPFDEAQSETPLGNSPMWIPNKYFPEFSEAEQVYFIRVFSPLGAWNHWADDPSWRIDQCFPCMMNLTLVGMQGLINRHGSSVFLDWHDPRRTRNPAHMWLEPIKEYKPVVELELDSLSAVRFLMRRFASRFAGSVIYDPEVPDTINLATMLAGLEDRMILAPAQLSVPGIPSFDSVDDLRILVQTQGWDASIEAETALYSWVYDNLWPQLEKRVIGLISPGPPLSRPIPPDMSVYLPVGIAARDLIVALRLSAIWLDPRAEPQASLMARFLADAPSPVPVFGNWASDEIGTTQLASRHGDWNASFTNGNAPLMGGNFSLFSGLRPEAERFYAAVNADRVLATLFADHIVAVYTSDGDNLAYQLDFGFSNFPWEGTEGYRFGWSTNPVLAEVAPLAWNYYLRHADGRSFVSGLSGAGYVYPLLMGSDQLEDYLKMTSHYLSKTGLRSLSVIGGYGDMGAWNHAIARTYYDHLNGSGYIGAFPSGSNNGQWGLGFDYLGVPTPSVYYSYINGHPELVETIMALQSDEILCSMSTYPWVNVTLVDDSDARGGAAALATASTDNQYPIAGPLAELAPGDYEVVYRLKVADTSGTAPIARLYVLDRFGDISRWHDLAEKWISPSDFANPGQYQEIILDLNLPNHASDIDFGVQYFGGATAPPGEWSSTDLYLDEIRVSRQSELDLPVFTAILAVTMYPGHPDDLAMADELTAAGALVVHPDTMAAALNPEYMIDLATPMLGASHPAIVDANTLLNSGLFLESLIEVRRALISAMAPRRTSGRLTPD